MRRVRIAHIGNINDRYILIGKLAIPKPDTLKWWRWFERANRHVASTRVGGIWISTVFLGLDHHCGDGLLILFETMAFRGGNGDECERCETWDQAEAQHRAMVEKVRREIKEKVNE